MYEFQPGQIPVIADVLSMIDTISEQANAATDPFALATAMTLLGAAATLAAQVVTKGVKLK
jgi:hypothetical protein